MPFTIKMVEPQKRRIVPVIGTNDCTLTVVQPTHRELFEQWEASTDAGSHIVNQSKLFEYRMRVIQDWAGFVDQDGQPLQFNPKTFDVAIRQSSGLFFTVTKATREAFEGLEAEDLKNSGTPSGPTTGAATPSTTESLSGMNTETPAATGDNVPASG